MRLVDEIVSMASDGKAPLADALRKCLVLSFDLGNEKLKAWLEKELNGYEKGDELPQYRKLSLYSRGNFGGPMGMQLPNRPLPMSILQKDDRDYLMRSRFAAPIGTYDAMVRRDKPKDMMVNWPPDLIVKYQDRFIEEFALTQAWQEVPFSMVLGLCEEVRNRLLRFALEIRQDLGQADDKITQLPMAKVEAAVVHHIYGGMNVIGSSGNVTQIGSINVNAGDFESLAEALRNLNVPSADVEKLRGAIEGDRKGFGAKTREWMVKAGTIVGKAGVSIGQDVIRELLLQFFDLK